MRRLLACAALLALACPAHAGGVIRGTLWPTRGEAKRADLARAQQPARRPSSGLFDFLGTPSLRKTPAPVAQPASAKRPVAKLPPPVRASDLRDAVVLVREVPPAVEKRLMERAARDRRRPLARVTITKSRYQPRVVAVAAGTSVEFRNADKIWHSVFSVSAASHFDLGKLKPGVFETLVLKRPGVINVHCDIHPDEAGFVVVAKNHVFAKADSLGHFELPKLPPGTYQLSLWHPLRGSREQQVVVPKRGDVTCDLAF